MDRPLIAGLCFSFLLLVLSYLINSAVLGRRPKIEAYELALTATAVFFLAILAESAINPIYEWFVGQKLWEYRVLPLHDQNVSGLAVLIWTAYGAHLYLTQQTLNQRLPEKWRNEYGKSFVIGFEAPFFFEVSGNAVFLVLISQYYAYYRPGDLFHFTSVQVVPVYMLCVFVGLVVLDRLSKLRRSWFVPAGLFAMGIAYLTIG